MNNPESNSANYHSGADDQRSKEYINFDHLALPYCDAAFDACNTLIKCLSAYKIWYEQFLYTDPLVNIDDYYASFLLNEIEKIDAELSRLTIYSSALSSCISSYRFKRLRAIDYFEFFLNSNLLDQELKKKKRKFRLLKK